MERVELDALVSFMLVHHPIPALPVVCGQGEGADYRETVASSHDLLANGIRFQMLHAQNFSEAQIEAATVAKTALLLALQEDITREVEYWRAADGGLSEAGLQRCYDIYCSAARAFQALYPGSLDLRTLQMQTVCRHDMVHTQSLSHFLARDQMFLQEAGPGTAPAPALPSTSTTYKNIIRASVLQLAPLGTQEGQ